MGNPNPFLSEIVPYSTSTTSIISAYTFLFVNKEVTNTYSSSSSDIILLPLLENLPNNLQSGLILSHRYV